MANDEEFEAISRSDRRRRRRHQMFRLDALHWVLLSALGLLFAAVFISPYRHCVWLHGQLLRIHRLTGRTERVTQAGWLEMKPIDPHEVLENEY